MPRRSPRLPAVLVLLAATAFALPAAADSLSEDFSDNSAGWTLGPEWQIGPAAASTGHAAGNGDPATDHSPGTDNGVAGTVIGGNMSTFVHLFYYLESPVVDIGSDPGSVTLRFWRHLN